MATFVRAPRERVYDALTQAEQLDAWLSAGAEIDARPAGTMRWRWLDWGPDHVTGEDSGPVLEARRPERYVFQWRPSSGVLRSRSTSRSIQRERWFGSASAATRTRQRAGQDSRTARPGWGEALTLLKLYVEHGLRY